MADQNCLVAMENDDTIVEPFATTVDEDSLIPNENDGESNEEKQQDASSSTQLLDAIATLDPVNARRYEVSRRSHFDRKALKRQMTGTIQRLSKLRNSKDVPVVSQRCTVVMAALAKAFVADVTTSAREIMNERKESGPIQPRHYREAWRRYSRTPEAQRTIYQQGTFKPLL